MIPVKHKTPLKSRTLSPSLNILSPNNDDFERAQVRAARAASHRRKSIGLVGRGDKDYDCEEDILGKGQILDLLQNCIKLAAENKINQRNTWELGLIDHISEIVNADDGEDAETNFQKASCTLEAGVKIYAYRVDSVHSETYKVLGGLNRTAAYGEDHEENNDSQNVEASEEEAEKKDGQKKISSSAAYLESYESLNVKKFDVAFTVDPLFNQMSARFDEGGAKGLLLNSLSVYGGCKLVFDSTEIPTTYRKLNSGPNSCEIINLISIRDCFQKLNIEIKMETESSPPLREILSMLDDPYRAASEMEEAKKNTDMNVEDYEDNEHSSFADDGGMGEVIDEFEVDQSEEINTSESVEEVSHDNTNWDYNGETYDEDVGQEGEESYDQGSFCGSSHEANLNENDAEQLVDWINPVVNLRSNTWAGPDHWKFRKSQDVVKDPEPHTKAAEKKKQRNEKFSIDFLLPPKVDMSIIAPATDLKSLMLPQSNSLPSTLLPDDFHYQPENLVRLYLQPSAMCLNHKSKQKSGIRESNNNASEMMNIQWDDGVTDNWDDENMHDDSEYTDEIEMIPQPRKVQKIEVDYDKTSKQIDVRVLKETLWQNLQETSSHQDSEEISNISFKSVLHQVPTSCGAASAQGDISVHLCFICLLHLANEHNLSILDCPTMDELYITNVMSKSNTSQVTTF